MAKRQPSPRPVPVSQVLREFLRPADLSALEQRSRIRQVWERVLPAAMLRQTRLVEVRRRELCVEVSAGPWMQELQFLKPRILQELEKALGPGIIRDVRFRLGDA